jgi:N6-adenosine-specific RNA methylase IME4
MNKFTCIVADPPWFFFDGLKMSQTPRGAAANYKLMCNEDIKNLPINKLADPKGCLLALWVPSSLLQTGLDTMKAWGFTHKQTYVWVKIKKNPFKHYFNNFIKNVNSIKDIKKIFDINIVWNDFLSFGMGRLFRQTHEICLIGINNNNIYKLLENKSQRSVCFSENMRHSSKPEGLQTSLELMFPNSVNKLEIFARRQRSGWVCIGNESPMSLGEDINESLNKLI